MRVVGEVDVLMYLFGRVLPFESGIQLLSCRDRGLVIGRSRVRSPKGEAGELNVFLRVHFLCGL